MWEIVIGTVIVVAVAIFMISWILHFRDPKLVDEDWLSFSNCIWFTFSTFIGESVMR